MKHTKNNLYRIACFAYGLCVFSILKTYSFTVLPESSGEGVERKAPETSEPLDSLLKGGKDRPPVIFTGEDPGKAPESTSITLETKEEESGRETIVSLGEPPKVENQEEQEAGIRIQTTPEAVPTNSVSFLRAFLNIFARLFGGLFGGSKKPAVVTTLEPVQEQETERAVTTLLSEANKALTENNYATALSFLDATQAYGRLATALENSESVSRDELQDLFDQSYNLLEKLAKNRISVVDADLIQGLAQSIDQQAKTTGITINPGREVKILTLSDVMDPYTQLEKLDELSIFTQPQRVEAQRLLKEIETRVQVLKTGKLDGPILRLLESLLQRAKELAESILRRHE